jgi:hypothetical protein
VRGLAQPCCRIRCASAVPDPPSTLSLILVAERAASALHLSRSRRVLSVVFVIAIGVLAARIVPPSRAGHFRYSAALACGVERWKVKTLQDRPRLLRARAIPMAQLVSHERPTPLPGTRLPFERRIWSVDAAVTLVRHEPDEDFHLVLESGADQMIAESPSSACMRGATAYRRRQMREAREKLRLCSHARVVGVAFFDFKHGQTGLAPNAIELHPMLDFACLAN